MSNFDPVGAVPATQSDAHLTDDGAVVPHVHVARTDGHVHMAMVGPDGDVPEARMSDEEARAVAALLLSAADGL